jgi:cytochrome c oxidase cbb3-type subunit I/II
VKVAANLKMGMVNAETNREIIAVIAYLQRLGTDIKLAPDHAPATASK